MLLSMVQFCCVISCGNRSNRELKKFYRLPNISKTCDKASYKADTVLNRRKQWLLNIGRDDLKDGDEAYSPGYIRVCSDHFVGGKPSAWSDVDNIDWAPTVKMGCDITSSQRKKPQKNTAEKRAMRIQELQKKKMMLGIATDAKPGKMAEIKEEVKKEASPMQVKGASSLVGTKQGKGKKNAAKRKIVKVQGLKGKSGLMDDSKQSKAPRKKVKASKKPEPTPTYSYEVRRMLKKQEIKVRRKILELELSGSNQSYGKPKVENPKVENPKVENPKVENLTVENLTVNPYIHRITLDSIPLAPEDGNGDAISTHEPISTDCKIAELIIVPETNEEVMDTKPEEVVDRNPDEVMDTKPEEVGDNRKFDEVIYAKLEMVVKDED